MWCKYKNKNLGLDDLIAKNHDEYIEKAIYYINNRFVIFMY